MRGMNYMRIKMFLVAAVLLAASTAWAVPAQLAHQGRLLDVDGVPLEGQHALTFALYDALTGGAVVWSESVDVNMAGGFYAVVLGTDEEDNPLDDLVLGNPPLWLELTVDDGEPLLPRHELLSVPYAVLAGTATNVEGGYVDATEIAVDGTLVIDADGNWVGPTPAVGWTDLSGVPSGLLDGQDADTLGALSCADEGIARFDLTTGLWVCGTDAVLTSGDVLGFVNGATLDFGIGSTVNGVTIATVADLDWSVLTGVPAEFVDGFDADSLAALGLTCADGDRPAWDVGLGDWVCTSEEVGLDRLDTASAIGGQVLSFDGSNVGWEDPATTTNPPCTLDVLNEPFGIAAVSCGGTPVLLRTWTHFAQVSTRSSHACGVTTGGAVQCWGGNSYGEGKPPMGNFTEVAAGGGHTCAIDGNGSVQCWGWDSYGQLTPPSTTFTQIDAGEWHTCGIDGGGAVQCWGISDGGALDYGQVTNTPSGTFTQVSAGHHNSCAIDGSGSVQCWGYNASGQSTPPAGTFTQVAAGSNHACAIDGMGSIQCWGANQFGQSTPPSGTFTQVSVSWNDNCGLDSNGAVQCWGRNRNGQHTPPVGTFSQVAVGSSHACGVLAIIGGTTIGTVACWGGGSFANSSP